ncbi:MAG: LD-carboxypeptidase [Candidatus Melainabacteria bacterium]|nr:LD-carboxypeptidase [Candidatus Melainabacteria bacterium]
MSVRLPNPLRKGSTIGLICPAGGFNDYTEVKRAFRYLTKMGYKVEIGNSVVNKKTVYQYLSGDDEARLFDLMGFWLDTSIDAIFCLKGGYGSLRLLKKINFEALKKVKKIILGFSDITVLLLALYAKTNQITFHGPLVGAHFLKRNYIPSDKRSAKHMFNILKDPAYKFSYNSKDDGVVLHPGKATGHLIGGNLTSICSMLGTDYLPDFKNSILFLEDCNEHKYTIDRMLMQMNNAGLLKGVAGIVFGSFYNSGFTSKKQVAKLLRDVVHDFNIPMIYYFPCGHGSQNYTLPIGRKVMLDADKLTLKSVD